MVRKSSIPAVVALTCLVALPTLARKGKTDFAEVTKQMNDRAKDLHSVSANLEYTKVTVLVDDKSIETGQLFYQRNKGKNVDIRIDIDKPDTKVILVGKNRARIY